MIERPHKYDGLENDTANFRCKFCGEYFTELELAIMRDRDELCGCGYFDMEEITHIERS